MLIPFEAGLTELVRLPFVFIRLFGPAYLAQVPHAALKVRRCQRLQRDQHVVIGQRARADCFIRPPHSPVPVPALTVSRAAGAKANSYSRS